LNNASCGGDSNGNAVGTGLIVFWPRGNGYCWYDFLSGIPDCYFDVAPPFFPSQPKDLFLYFETTTTPPAVTLACKGVPSANGFAYAIYEDGKTTGFMRKHFYANTTTLITYPADFHGVNPPVLASARILSRFFLSVIPLPIVGNDIGYCNSTG
jgi:hypothetical protein